MWCIVSEDTDKTGSDYGLHVVPDGNLPVETLRGTFLSADGSLEKMYVLDR